MLPPYPVQDAQHIPSINEQEAKNIRQESLTGLIHTHTHTHSEPLTPILDLPIIQTLYLVMGKNKTAHGVGGTRPTNS